MLQREEEVDDNDKNEMHYDMEQCEQILDYKVTCIRIWIIYLAKPDSLFLEQYYHSLI